MTDYENHILSQFFLRLGNAYWANADTRDFGCFVPDEEKRKMVAEQSAAVRVLVNYVLANGERIKDEVNRL